MKKPTIIELILICLCSGLMFYLSSEVGNIVVPGILTFAVSVVTCLLFMHWLHRLRSDRPDSEFKANTKKQEPGPTAS